MPLLAPEPLSERMISPIFGQRRDRAVPPQYPDPMPVAVLGRLAIDQAWQGRGIGRGLFGDCARRLLNAGDILGIRGIVVHEISEHAKAFYLALGFVPSPLDPMTSMVTLADVRAVVEDQTM